MTTVRKTITLTQKQDAWIKAQIERGDFTNDSEYVRELIRRDQDRAMRFEALKQAITDGLESGVSDRAVAEIWAEAEREQRIHDWDSPFQARCHGYCRHRALHPSTLRDASSRKLPGSLTALFRLPGSTSDARPQRGGTGARAASFRVSGTRRVRPTRNQRYLRCPHPPRQHGPVEPGLINRVTQLAAGPHASGPVVSCRIDQAFCAHLHSPPWNSMLPCHLDMTTDHLHKRDDIIPGPPSWINLYAEWASRK